MAECRQLFFVQRGLPLTFEGCVRERQLFVSQMEKRQVERAESGEG